MTRIIDNSGTVHYRHPANAKFTLCGGNAFDGQPDLFGGSISPLRETVERVDCPACARVVCACRNEHYNTLVDCIEADVLMRATYDAVMPDGEVM